MKVCSKCKKTKRLTDFYWYKPNSCYRSQCKSCMNESSVSWARNNKPKIAVIHRRSREKHLEKALIRERQYKAENKERTKIRWKEYSLANREKLREAGRKWHSKNIHIIKQKYIQNRDRYLANGKTWRLLNPAKVRAKYIQYMYRRHQATPKFADFDLMNDMYLEAKYFGLEVDHMVPIKGKTVCGLHWEGNLQLLTGQENASKGNRFP